MASHGSVTTGSGSYSTTTARAARSANSSVSAATAATGSPMRRTLSASTNRSLCSTHGTETMRSLKGTCGTSSHVITTAPIASAALVSTLLMTACAYGLAT